MKKHAVALRAFNHEATSYAKGDTILGLESGHFNDWSAPGVDLVREASAAEVARARGEPAEKAAKAPARRKPRKAAPATAEPTPPLTEPAPAPAADA